jgi:hypothetical protein
MQMQYNRQSEQSGEMHQYDLADCAAAARYMDVKEWMPRRHDGNGQKTSGKMPG